VTRRGGWKLWLALFATMTTACGGSSDVVVHKDITYYDGPGHDEKKHLLDLYLPADAEDFPVLLFIHGGGWRHGYKDGVFNPYHRLGKGLARRGVGVAVATYRLAPRHKFPAQLEDVARAVRWTYEHIGEYGGDPRRLFLCGHSAGAHLVALAALDERYLEAEGLPADAVAGVVGLSGPYDVALLKEDAGWCWFAGWYFVEPTFGEEAENWEAASAPRYASAAAPPFLLLYADGDIPHLAAQAYRLSSALAREGVRAPVYKIDGRNHYTIIYNVGEEDDAATALILDFIEGRQAPAGNASVPE
jgi:acetyl esterase/lipase